MESFYPWPESPGLSIFTLWLSSVVFLWAARAPMLRALRGLSRSLEQGIESVTKWCADMGDSLSTRHRETLRAASELELQSRISREIVRIDDSFAEKLGRYAGLQRKVDDLVSGLEDDYKQCGDSPPQVPAWAGAVEAVAAIPNNADPNVRKVLEGIKESMTDAEKRAFRTYKDDTAARHRVLGKMRPTWKEIRTLLASMKDAVTKAVQTSSKLSRYVDEYDELVNNRESEAHARNYSPMKPFITSLIVMGVALGGAFVNFQLIALPMSELVPAGARLGGIPVSTVSALVLVLMEVAVGIFLMDMLGITDLFPKLATVAPSRRRLILWLSLSGLLFLSSVESSLAILREQIVAADAVLKQSLAGQAGEAVGIAAGSQIPVIGQAVLGFVLPWLLALVAIPLEMMLDSGRHVVAKVSVLAVHTLGGTTRVVGHMLCGLTGALPSVYDVYIAIPLRLERIWRDPDQDVVAYAKARARSGKQRVSRAGVA
ncbi:MAG: hypothetical protein VX681_09270 [Myxococcota bacterium]|nr:hypothetical protein [Myxococcota bacterium]